MKDYNTNYIINGTILLKYCGNDPYPIIPLEVTEIGDEAFAYCTFLEGIRIPKTVTKVSPTAFVGCINLIPGINLIFDEETKNDK